MPSPGPHHRRYPCRHRLHALAAACLLTPTLAARATTYDLTAQAVDVSTAPYTADDTLNCTGVTFNASAPNATLLPTLNLLPGDVTTVTGGTGITLAGPLSGTGSFAKSGTGTLTLTAPGPSFTGPATISSGGTLRLTDPLALGPASAPTPVTLSGTLDLTGALPARPLYLSAATLLNDDPATPVTLGASLPLTPTKTHSFTLAGAGDITFASPLAHASTLTKTGAGTATFAVASPVGTVTVSAGTLRLGTESPFAGNSGKLTLATGATLDLNGFNPGKSVTLATGAAVVNDNPLTSVTFPTPSFVVAGTTATFGGAGTLVVPYVPATLNKTGTGTLAITAANTFSARTVNIPAGTVRLDDANAIGSSTSNTVNLTGGSLDLNGFPAPTATYAFSNSGALVNNNTSTPVTLTTAAATLTGSLSLGGAGTLIVNRNLPSTFTKVGAGTLVLNNPALQSFADARVLGGTLLLGSQTNQSGVNYYSGSLILTGSAPGAPYLLATVDLNGRNWRTPIALTLGNNGGVVNNNTATPAFLDTGTNVTFLPGTPNPDIVLGGDGRLNVERGNGTASDFSRAVIHKIGPGLLSAGFDFYPKSLVLHAGTYWAELNASFGSAVSFQGGTLRIAPAYDPRPTSYTFTPSLTVNPTLGNAIDAQRPTTFTGLLTGAGPLAKLGTASLTLNPAPSSRLALDVQAGALLLRPAAGTPAITSLSLAPATTLDVAGNLVLDYSDQSPADTVRQYLGSHQLTSAAADPAHLTLACVEASTLLSLTGSQTSTWSGQPVDATTLLLQVARFGDANLNGKIDADDYALLDRAYAQSLTNAHWTDGDFNNDGTVTTADYLLIDSTLASQSPLSADFLSLRESQFGANYVSNLLATVPEPSSLAACAFAILASLARRRRS